MKTFGNFILKILELFKSDTQTKIAKYIMGAGLVLIIGTGTLSYTFKEHTFSYSDEANSLGYVFLFIGLILLLHRYLTIQKDAVSLAYGRGIENMNIQSPREVIPNSEKYDCIEINLKNIDSYIKDDVIQNYYFNKELIQTRTLNKNSKKIYIGALGSFPYLFLLGSLFRNAYSNVEVLDFNRHKNGGKWYKLPLLHEGEKLITHKLTIPSGQSIENIINNFNINNKNNEVGIALGYTFTTNKNAIPKALKDNTLFLETSLGTGHDILSSEEVQTELLKELSNYMALLWNGHNKIHLFVSAQASMCINIGKMYMNNAHGLLVIYNYDNKSRLYNWSIEFNKGNLI